MLLKLPLEFIKCYVNIKFGGTMKILLTSHSLIAQAMFDALLMMCTEVKDLDVIGLENDGQQNYEIEIIDYLIKNKKHEILVITDIIGGSPFITCCKNKFISDNIEIVTGMNFAMVLEACLSKDSYSLQNLVGKILYSAEKSISRCDSRLLVENEGDE